VNVILSKERKGLLVGGAGLSAEKKGKKKIVFLGENLPVSGLWRRREKGGMFHQGEKCEKKKSMACAGRMGLPVTKQGRRGGEAGGVLNGPVAEWGLGGEVLYLDDGKKRAPQRVRRKGKEKKKGGTGYLLSQQIVVGQKRGMPPEEGKSRRVQKGKRKKRGGGPW